MMNDKVDFVHVDKHESFLQTDIMILIEIAMHSQSSQNSKFPISLQYLRKEVRNRVHFLHAGKHQSFYKLALSF